MATLMYSSRVQGFLRNTTFPSGYHDSDRKSILGAGQVMYQILCQG